MSDDSRGGAPRDAASTSAAVRGPVLSRRQLGGLVFAVGGATVLGTRPAAARAASRGLSIADVPAAAPALVGQPYASNWHPAQLVGWDYRHDPTGPYMLSTTPIAERLVDRLTIANPEAKRRRVLACSAFAPTDGNPAQGSAEFDYYTSEFWTYIDTVIFWGGSASEGLILAPNPTVTDAAHRNGVPVYGTVFFPPNVYGGDIQWVRDLLQRDADGFPVARALAAIAETYGFEGWFFNQETSGGDKSLADDMIDFLAELRGLDCGVLWYDAMIESGAVAWQGELDSLNDAFFAESEGMFVDFGWYSTLDESAAYAKSMKRDPDELFAGIDVGARQFSVQQSMDQLFPATGESGLSVALYRPDFTFSGTDDKSQYAARESRFWVGSDSDPSTSTADADGWRGMSADIGEHTTVLSVPFVTRFGTGHGTSWWHRGKRWQQGEWNNLTAQDVLPTWRWVVDGSDLAVEYDYDRAWEGGSSLAISGRLTEAATLWLYAARVELSASTTVRVAAAGANLSVVLRFADDPGTEVAVPLGTAAADWTTLETAPLAAYAGRTLSALGVRFEGSGALDARLGELLVHDGRAARPGAARKVRVDASGPGYRVRWKGEPGVRYDLEAVSGSKARTWLGASTAAAFYVADLPADAERVELVPLGVDGRRGPKAGAPIS